MIEKLFITLIAFVLVSASCAVSVFADPVVLPPDLNGFADDMQDATSKYARGMDLMLDNVLDLLTNKKSVSEFISDSYALATEYGLGFVTDVINSVDQNTITSRELVNIMINAVKRNISQNGGSVSTFPVSGTQIGIPGGGYIDFYPSERINQPGFFDLSYRVFAPDGTLAHQSGWSLCSHPPSGVAPFYNIFPLDYYVQGSVTHLTVSFDYYPFLTAPVPSVDVYIPWVIYDGDFDFITDTPDVDDLSDDDLIKYIDNLLNSLNTMYPDLSTVEGLLRAILNQLKNSGGCDCSDVLAQINAAIISLANDSNSQNAQIIALLQGIKDNVNNNNGNGTVNDIDLDPLLQKLDKIIADLDYLKLINTIELLTDGWDKLTAAEKSYLDEYAKLIVTMGNKFGFTAINNIISSLNGIVFTNVAPRDLTFIYQGKTYVFLSVSMFGKFSSSVVTVRSFISILIILSWAYHIRKKIMEGI